MEFQTLDGDREAVLTVSPPRDYSEIVRAVDDARDLEKPELSVIIVAYQRPKLLSACLDSLRTQSHHRFEVIIAHNGGAIIDDSWRSDLSIACVHLKQNYRQIVARNVGASFSRAPLLYLIDDDTLVHQDTLQNLVAFFRSSDVVAARSRMLFRSNVVFNQLAVHYDLGDELLEGRMQESGFAIRASTYRRFGGYDEGLVPGAEGLYWLYHVGKTYGTDKIVYYPGAIIWTDYAPDLRHFVWKNWNYAQGEALMKDRSGELLRYFDEVVSSRHNKNPVGRRVVTLSQRLLRGLASMLRWGGKRYYAIRSH